VLFRPAGSTPRACGRLVPGGVWRGGGGGRRGGGRGGGGEPIYKWFMSSWWPTVVIWRLRRHPPEGWYVPIAKVARSTSCPLPHPADGPGQDRTGPLPCPQHRDAVLKKKGGLRLHAQNDVSAPLALASTAPAAWPSPPSPSSASSEQKRRSCTGHFEGPCGPPTTAPPPQRGYQVYAEVARHAIRCSCWPTAPGSSTSPRTGQGPDQGIRGPDIGDDGQAIERPGRCRTASRSLSPIPAAAAAGNNGKAPPTSAS